MKIYVLTSNNLCVVHNLKVQTMIYLLGVHIQCFLNIFRLVGNQALHA